MFLVQYHPNIHLDAPSNSLMLTGHTNARRSKPSNQISKFIDFLNLPKKKTHQANNFTPLTWFSFLKKIKQRQKMHWNPNMLSDAQALDFWWRKTRGGFSKMPPRFRTNELPKQLWRKAWTTATSYQHINTQIASAVQLCSSSSLDFHVSPCPLSSLPALFVFEVRIQIHITPLFTGQDLNYRAFRFSKPKFIAAGLFLQAPGASWNTTTVKPQSFCSAPLRRVVGPLFFGSVGSAQDCFGQRVATSEVRVTVNIVFCWSYIL